MVRKVGVLGDIHGEFDALQTAIQHYRDQGIETILAVGDIVDGPGDVDACCDLLREEGVGAVRGNHDRWFLAGEKMELSHKTRALRDENARFLQELPTTQTWQTPHGAMLLCHGVGEDDMAVLSPETQGYGLQAISALRGVILDPDITLMVGGHTHRKMVRQFAGLIVINAGTLFREHDPCFLTLDFDARLATYREPKKGCPLLEELEIPHPKVAGHGGSAW